MPLFDYLCQDCGELNEILVTASYERPQCKACGSSNLQKMLSAHSSLSGEPTHRFPGHGDTACCGTSPVNADCAGPGSCCGKNHG